MAMTYNERDVVRIETGRSIAEAVGGIVVGILAIVSLAQAFPSLVLIGIAVIVLGIALLAEGRTIAAETARFTGLHVDTGPVDNRSTVAPESVRYAGAGPVTNLHTGGTTLEFLAGIAIVVLGILALIGIVPEILIAVAVIIAGAAMIVTSGTLLEMSDLHAQLSGVSDPQRRLARASASGAVSIQMLCGVGAIVLGILALTTVPVNGLLLSEIGLLVLAAAIMLGSGLWSGSLFRMMR